MPPDNQLARMDRLVQVLVRRKPIAAFFRISRQAPTTLSGAPHTAAGSNAVTRHVCHAQKVDILRKLRCQRVEKAKNAFRRRQRRKPK
jgi:hypothetical protein